VARKAQCDLSLVIENGARKGKCWSCRRKKYTVQTFNISIKKGFDCKDESLIAGGYSLFRCNPAIQQRL